MRYELIDLQTSADIARLITAAEDNEPPANDNRASALWWAVPVFLFWCGLIAWWI